MKKIVTLLLVLAMVFSLAIPALADEGAAAIHTEAPAEAAAVEAAAPAAAEATEAAAPAVSAAAVQSLSSLAATLQSVGDLPDANDEGVITLDKDYGSETVDGTQGTIFDFSGFTGTLNLAGHKLMGVVTNATGVTVENRVSTLKAGGDPEKTEDYELVDTPATLLAATGTYANDVSKYVADGYDAKVPDGASATAKTEVFNNEDNSNFNIVLEVTADKGDRDTSSTDIQDVFADEIVTVTVKVTGARYVSVDMMLTWDKALFDDATKSRDLNSYSGWIKQTNGDYRLVHKGKEDVSNPQNEYFEDGEVIGKFQFKAKYIDEEIVTSKSFDSKDAVVSAAERGSYNVFTVKSGSASETAKVIGSWRKATKDAYTQPLNTTQLQDDVAHIVLMDSMTGSVEAKTGLIYKAIEQPLLNKTYNTNGYSALVGGEPVANSKVATVVMTKANYDTAVASATPETPFVPAYGTAGTSLTDANIQATNAGDYVVCYKVSAPGYVSSVGTRAVHIDKQPVTLTWIAPAYNEAPTGDKTFSDTKPSDYAGGNANFYGQFDAVGFKNPTATFVDLTPTTVTIGGEENEVLLTSGPNGDTQKDVGAYLFTAAENPNYEFTNPTCTVQVVGMKIEGYQLTATGSTTDPTTGVMYRDGIERPIGSLVTDGTDVTNFLNPEDATIVYEYFDGKYYTSGNVTEGHEVGDEIWTVTEDPTVSPKYFALGEYKLRMTVTADNYEKLTQEVTFTIKDPIFKIETTEYVAGYTLVLVYTNEDVQFRYDNTMMYDESMFGYKYMDTTSYTHVYGLVVKGDADESLVYASNNEAQKLQLPGEESNYGKVSDNKGNVFINDVNNKTNTTVDQNEWVDLDDLTAVQSIYNVNAGNMLDMVVVLRSDVNRDKKVNTVGDVAQVMAYYLEH